MSTLASIVIVGFVVLASSLALAKIFGAGAYVVLSGSMEPTYPVGSLLYEKKVNPEELEVGDVITYVIAQDRVVTHRIADVMEDESGSLWFTTKGDNNDIEDANPIHEKNVLGTPILTIPMVGYLVGFMTSPVGRYVTMGIVVVLFGVGLMPLFQKKKEEVME